MYLVKWTKKAQKDSQKIKRAGLAHNVGEILRTVRQNPYEPSQGFEKLSGKKDTYSRDINYYNRFVYVILPNTENIRDANGEPYQGIIKITRMWTHSTKK